MSYRTSVVVSQVRDIDVDQHIYNKYTIYIRGRSIETAICDSYVRSLYLMLWGLVYDRKKVKSDGYLLYTSIANTLKIIDYTTFRICSNTRQRSNMILDGSYVV